MISDQISIDKIKDDANLRVHTSSIPHDSITTGPLTDIVEIVEIAGAPVSPRIFSPRLFDPRKDMSNETTSLANDPASTRQYSNLSVRPCEASLESIFVS